MDREDILKQFGLQDKVTKEEKDPNLCKGCGETGMIFEDEKQGEKVCVNCGLVTEKVIDTGAEWRTVNDPRKVNPVRCEIQSTKFTNLSPTMISGGKNSQNLEKTMKRTMTMMYSERTIYMVEKEFMNLCEGHGISINIINNATEMYKSIYNSKNFDGKKEIHRGNKLKGIKAACLYLTIIKQKKITRRTPREIADIIGVSVKVLNEAEKQVIEILDLYDTLPKPTTHRDILDSFSLKMKKKGIVLSFQLIERAKRVGDIAKENNLLLEKVPKSVAAGCLWYVLNKKSNLVENKKISKQDIHRCTGVSGVTVQKVFETLLKIQDKIDKN